MRYKNRILSGLLVSATILSLFSIPYAVFANDDVGVSTDVSTEKQESTEESQEKTDEAKSKEEEKQEKAENKEFKSRREYVEAISGEQSAPSDMLSVDTAPIYANLLQTIIYAHSTEGAAKNAIIGYSDMEKFAKPLNGTEFYSYRNALTYVEGESGDGQQLANNLQQLQKNGILITERERTGILGFWDKTSNTFKRFTNSVGTVWTLNVASGFTFITEPIGKLSQGATDGLMELVDGLTPTSIFGYVGGIDYGDSDFGQLMKIFVEEFVGTGETFRTVIQTVVVVSAGFITIIGIVSVYLQFGRGKVSESFTSFRKYSLMILVPVLFTATLPNYARFRQDIANSINTSREESQLSSDDRLIIDVKKWAFVSNFEGMTSIVADTSPDNIANLNAKINARLSGASTVDAKKLVEFFETDQTAMDKLLGGETFTANQYIKFIQTASKKGNREVLDIQANELPNGVQWGNVANTFWVNRYNPLHPYVGDTVMVDGQVKFIDNNLGKTASVSSDNLDKERFLSVGDSKNEVSYNTENYSFTEVRRSNAWTYIYGGRSNGSFMSSLLDNYTFGSSLTLADDLTERVGRGIKAEGSDNKITDDVGSLEKDSDYYLQLSNALKIAILNRYAGVSNSNSTSNNDALSNQSTFFLLSSHITDDGLELFLKNNNFNESDQGKSGSNTEVWVNRFVMPASGEKDYFAKLGIINSQSLAVSIISVGMLLAVVKTNIGSLIFPIWAYLKNIYLKGSVLAVSMFYISDMTLLLLKSYSKLILTGFYNTFNEVTRRIAEEGLFQSTSALALTVILAVIALLMVWPFFSVKGHKKQSFVELVLNMVLILRDSAVEPLQKLENILYGKTFDQGKTQADIDPVGGTMRSGSKIKTLLAGFGAWNLGRNMSKISKSLNGELDKSEKKTVEKPGGKGREDVGAPSIGESGTTSPVGEDSSVVTGPDIGISPNQSGTEDHIFKHKDIFANQAPNQAVIPTGSSALLKRTTVGRGLSKVVSGANHAIQTGGEILSKSGATIRVAGQTSLKFTMADNQTRISMVKEGASKAGKVAGAGLAKVGRVATVPVQAVKGRIQEINARAENSVQQRATKQAEAEVWQKSDFNKIQYLAKQADVASLRKLDADKLDLSAQERGEFLKLKKALAQENSQNIEIEKSVLKDVKKKYGLSAIGGSTQQGQEAYVKYRKEIEYLIKERQQEASKQYKSTAIIKDLAIGFDAKVAEVKPVKVQEVKTEYSLWNEQKGNEKLTSLVNFAKNVRRNNLED